MKTSIILVDASVLTSNLIDSWARLYCKIWLDAPWFEDFWKPEEVIRDFRSEMSQQDAVGYIAVDGDEVVGFTHGYSVDKVELRAITGNDLLDPFVTDRVFYVDELGVDLKYRGAGISRQLTTHLLSAVSISTVLLRTDKNAHAARALYQKLGFKELPVHDSKYSDRTYWLLAR